MPPVFDLSNPGVAVMPSTFGGGWAWSLNDEGASALAAYFDDEPADLPPIGREGYIVEPYDTGDLAEHLRACGVAWKVCP